MSSTLLQSHNSGACSCTKSLVPALPSFAAIGAKGRFFLISDHISGLAAFLGTTPPIQKKMSLISGAEFNSASNSTIFQSKIRKIKKLVWQFLFAPFHFLAILINFIQVFIFWGDFPKRQGNPLRACLKQKNQPGQGEKIMRLSQEEPILERKQKKTLFHYICRHKYLCNFFIKLVFLCIQINAKVCSVFSQLSQSSSKLFRLLRSYQRI